jgi:putative transposase
MTLWHTYYHLVWATHDRLPLITADREPILYGHLVEKIIFLEAHSHAIGGISDHVHLVVSIPPKIAISDFVKRLKGSSARYINQYDEVKNFAWQREYAVFSLGSQQLDRAVEYVQNQKRRHQDLQIVNALEMMS